MLKNQNIICISTIDWDFVWQGHQEIMSTLARNGNRVLFIENTGVRTPNFNDLGRLRHRLANWFKSTKGFREVVENLYVYSPVILPFPYSRPASWINRRMLIKPIRNWTKVVEFHDPIVWAFLPTRVTLDIIDAIETKLIIYYCMADFSKLASNPKGIKRTEEKLIKKSDLVFAQGTALGKKCRLMNNNVYIFPCGVKIEEFENFQQKSLREIPFDLKGIKRPIIGYVGGIHKHMDFKLLKFIAETHPEWSVVLIGPAQTEVREINSLKNIFLLGKKDFSELPSYINEFNVGVIPYDKSAYTDTVYPNKLNEYHALGKPVVSTQLPEIVNFNAENENIVLVGKTHEEFAACISRAINNTDKTTADMRISSAKKNNWHKKIEEMSGLIEGALDKNSGVPLDWETRFREFYKTAHKKILNTAVIFLSAYLVIFYTPLFWFFSEPLKISQAPQKADAIVVFAGGVGESGQAAQGYEERVEAAVDLYAKGYASHIIFSSGYTYVFKEPLVMKALAVELNVPENAIILEDKAKNTYENVKFTEAILRSNGWKKILLVSSPYHMKRVSLVMNKAAPGLKVIYTPVPKSRFYSHELEVDGKKVWQRVNLGQIKGIIHECLGIIYYFIKGYI
ncbi:MAG: ElyC/SanA/YdcF family protein [Candidatus Omnitrophica bacterium]|nr:ElyC/SanA/YdcF family protein [Candidatus Omnitrophota bacterium]